MKLLKTIKTVWKNHLGINISATLIYLLCIVNPYFEVGDYYGSDRLEIIVLSPILYIAYIFYQYYKDEDIEKIKNDDARTNYGIQNSTYFWKEANSSVTVEVLEDNNDYVKFSFDYAVKNAYRPNFQEYFLRYINSQLDLQGLFSYKDTILQFSRKDVKETSTGKIIFYAQPIVREKSNNSDTTVNNFYLGPVCISKVNYYNETINNQSVPEEIKDLIKNINDKLAKGNDLSKDEKISYSDSLSKWLSIYVNGGKAISSVVTFINVLLKTIHP
ncbi:hypothetical protein [Convivina intestini]|uniref:hypothetical protein n=1 Tax=Convivina intestini TaxID=1505726 RepID=UPI00200DFB96|nr:hypothetical protein [Convivina intestini]CAH1853284.1 hypothetical protein R078131_00722 [Convivina intestini]